MSRERDLGGGGEDPNPGRFVARGWEDKDSFAESHLEGERLKPFLRDRLTLRKDRELVAREGLAREHIDDQVRISGHFGRVAATATPIVCRPWNDPNVTTNSK